jgi:hypothetical protein
MNFNTEQIIRTIKAMRKQEENNGYSVSDYLAELPIMTEDTTAAAGTNNTTTNNNDNNTPVDASCRFVMVKWANTVSDYCNYSKETVAIALSCLDRFVSTKSGQHILLDRHLFQLAAMTALYTSVKINEEEVMDPDTVSALSRGVHSKDAIIEMESKMLTAIQWKVHPPTSMSFVRMILDLVSSDYLTDSVREVIIEKTRPDVETIINEYDFCTYNASLIAFACILNTIEENIMDDGTFYDKFETIIGNVLDVEPWCVQNLRFEIQEFILDSNNTKCSVIDADTVTKTMTLNNTSCTAGSSNIAKESSINGIHSSPRAVTTANGVRCSC